LNRCGGEVKKAGTHMGSPGKKEKYEGQIEWGARETQKEGSNKKTAHGGGGVSAKKMTAKDGCGRGCRCSLKGKAADAWRRRTKKKKAKTLGRVNTAGPQGWVDGEAGGREAIVTQGKKRGKGR